MALAGALVWFPTTPAAAHTDLVSSTPAPDASLDAPPVSVALTFSDEMTERYAQVALTAPDGTPAGQSSPTVAGTSATLPVRPGLGPGRYTVGYRVVSADGHPVAGSFTFTVKTPPLTPPTSAPAQARTETRPSAPVRTSTPTPSSTPTPDAVKVPAPLFWSVGAVVSGVAVAGVVAVCRRRRRSRDAR
ncbi:copper resistance CopC family protein [Streptomyces sp. NPDC004779]